MSIRSWLAGETERVAVKCCEQFEEAWDGLAEGLSVLAPKGEVLDRLRARAPRSLRNSTSTKTRFVADPRWRHQDDAVAAFMEARAGILEMATGTGKTRTAVKDSSTGLSPKGTSTARLSPWTALTCSTNGPPS